jgi:hypothetical protein
MAAALGLLFAACGDDHPEQVDELTISGVWARPTPANATNGVVYLTVASPVDDAIVGVAVPAEVAADATLHETMGDTGGTSPMANMPNMTTAGGEMTMEPVESVALPAHTPIKFEPGGYHIMLTGLAAPLLEGSTFELTVEFANGLTVRVPVVVGQGPASD